jgi:hypothetical protein
MKRPYVLAGLALAAWLVTAGGPAHAQFSITITVNENGQGTFTNTNGFFSPLPAALLPDPGPGGLPAALTYGLLNPPGLVAGDLFVSEPGMPGLISDVIRFNPQQNGGSLVFYSDNFDGAPSLADTGPPLGTSLFTTAVEVGPEAGPNGFSYTPTAGLPGFIAGAAGPVTYVIQSDPAPSAVPAPASLTLGAIGSAVAAGFGWLRRRRAAAAAAEA